jgi:hypothetical protein
MAKQVNMFQFTGTLGNVVGYRYRGEYRIRRKPVSKNGKPSMAQLVQQAKFCTVTNFVSRISNLLRTTYIRFHGNMSAANHLTRYILQNAITGEYPDFSIAYNKVPVTRGNMNSTFGEARALLEQVEFRWDTDTGSGRGTSTDRAILVLYCKAFNCCIYTTAGPPRNAGVAAIGVPGLVGQTVHTWLGFISEDGKEVSDSVYTGTVTVT